ncbi:MAG: sporulation protein YqfD [Prevotella sp.]|nr:sporulation protein YqfD [Prevotella sp.]
MSRIKKFLVGQVEFRVQGLPISCLNKLRNYYITRIRTDGETITFFAPLIHASAIKKLVSNFEYQMQENYNLFRGINFLLNHLVLVTSIIVSLAVFLISDMGIYDVQVQCDDDSLAPAVYQYLNDLGVKKFMWKNQLQHLDLATDLVSNFDNIAHANVRVAGNTLVVNLVAVNNQKQKSKTNFYAQYDAVIKEVTAYSGTALVTAGDVVKKGDLLVADAYPHSVVVTGEVAFVNGDQITRLEIWII